ncbi:LacI family DNA-binding transcriptional regulator [Streptomyces cavernicola]|uniref:LacI family DNA-binding transcriptional regulator n=1 Tax=Streptomyces cavernicola TaxID=3043613 RepID=A0ABT6S5N8_9ACTN|nr:LacI family DNA-binding transcriptional regulator [Streptomyces sp. B-S-A6]MDI3403401.1 LacI family DNA-binding transcriptional regulator [Streptomyces sp. B-S-A6]
MTDRPSPQGGASRSPTIYDVAAAAGVAPSTVSRAFSRPGRVNAATAERIRQVAAELGYHANPLARALPTGRTTLIACVIADIANPVFAEIVIGAQKAAREAGYLILLVDAQESDQLERESLERTLPAVEGIVLASSRMSDSAIRMIAKQRPLIVLNRVVSDVTSLVNDDMDGMRQAVQHLSELGHRTITYLSGPEASWASGVRWRALHEAASELGVRVHRTGAYPPTVAGGLQAAAELGRPKSSAVIAYNDQMAIGLMRGLQAAGIQVPRELSVVGFDNISGSELVTPELTTIAAPARIQGHTAVRTLLAEVGDSQAHPGKSAILPTRLVVRQSTACRRRTPPAARACETPAP